MRKVVFYIDDLEYFRKTYNLSEVQMNDIFQSTATFKAIYTLYGENKNIFKYELTDDNHNKIAINNLNGYQRGVVLNDCMAYFAGTKYSCDTDSLCGVVKIEEFEI